MTNLEDLLDREDRACYDADWQIFFPDNGEHGIALLPALALCARCPVQTSCLEYALERPMLDGIWGGTTPKGRQRMRRPGVKQ